MAAPRMDTGGGNVVALTPSCAPHWLQKLAVAGTPVPQRGQVASSLATSSPMGQLYNRCEHPSPMCLSAVLSGMSALF